MVRVFDLQSHLTDIQGQQTNKHSWIVLEHTLHLLLFLGSEPAGVAVPEPSGNGRGGSDQVPAV